MPKPRSSESLAATDRFGQPGRAPLDHCGRALGREVTRAEARAAGRHDQTGEPVTQLAQRGRDRVDAVGRDPVLHHLGIRCLEAGNERATGLVFTNAFGHSVRDGEDLR